MGSLKFIITGNVQGVGLRFSTLKKAKEVGVTGWIKNELDGSVQGIFSGDERELRIMKEWLIEVSPGENKVIDFFDYPSEVYQDFQVLY